MRLDAIKHYWEGFLRTFVDRLDQTVGSQWFFVGEYWTWNSEYLSRLNRRLKARVSFFDVKLLYNFSEASKKRTDLRITFHGSLSSINPEHAVVYLTLRSSYNSANSVTDFVQNHDSQKTQSLEAPVEQWFLPRAYSPILLRQDIGYPCLFYGDLYGI